MFFNFSVTYIISFILISFIYKAQQKLTTVLYKWRSKKQTTHNALITNYKTLG